MRLVQKQSHSINRGMFTKDIGTPYRDYDAIDLALRTDKPPVIFQKPVPRCWQTAALLEKVASSYTPLAYTACR